MLIEELSLETRSKIYTLTKKVLRKYQKGIISGKLTSEKFVNNILCDVQIHEVLSSDIIEEIDFIESYHRYVDKLISIQNESLLNGRKKNYSGAKEKVDVSKVIKLRHLLDDTGYALSIPSQYLSARDIDNISKFITTGDIDLGNENIYNYVHKKH
ncbi:hypothetical protein EXD82_06560 [Peptacetobacter hominis]|uniref:Uncharacterized protein n=1 Tax=Peptacetobacter hominis TaxID=2743610 RepID=A0A544QUT7_9FIRM|nr:hypothetical protein [Peptacetobacter hominis]TQQ84462.1 hypothetical protein EXD82_06560 [Peptacetobacter hominis]